jgi:hypothetical protein
MCIGSVLFSVLSLILLAMTLEMFNHITSSGKLEIGRGCIQVVKSFSLKLVIAAFSIIFCLLLPCLC